MKIVKNNKLCIVFIYGKIDKKNLSKKPSHTNWFWYYTGKNKFLVLTQYKGKKISISSKSTRTQNKLKIAFKIEIATFSLE